MREDKSYSNFIRIFACLVAGGLLTAFFVDTSGNTILRPQFIIICFVLVLLLLVFYKKLPKKPVFWVIFAGIFIRFCYIYYTEVWCRQHDVVDFGVGEGQAAYIEYFLEHKRIPDFDPRSIWGFFQPPLHHMISAAWMWFMRRMGIGVKLMQENVQILTIIYMIIVMIIVNAICKELKMKNEGRLITMLIVCLHPLFIIFSGSINNDALSFALTVAALYVAIIWNNNPGYGLIIILALLVGLSMFAKLSSGLIAPAIAALMLYKLIANKKEWKKYISQYIVFGVIVFPIGLYWTIRNMIRFNMPANYIPPVGEQLTHSTIIYRLFDIRIHSVYPAMIAHGDAYDEYNTLVMIMKSSLFGEYNYGQISPVITLFAVVLFIVGTLLAIASLYATINMIFSKKSMMELDKKLLLGIGYVGFLAGYLSFSLGYNNFSAQDFRYAALCIVIEAIFLGLWADEQESKIVKIVLWTSFVFALSSFIVYFMIGLF